MAQAGWRAECQTCPTTVGDYGETICVNHECPDVVCAEIWALVHSDRHRGHCVRVSRFFRWEPTFADVNSNLLRRILGEQ